MNKVECNVLLTFLELREVTYENNNKKCILFMDMLDNLGLGTKISGKKFWIIKVFENLKDSVVFLKKLCHKPNYDAYEEYILKTQFITKQKRILDIKKILNKPDLNYELRQKLFNSCITLAKEISTIFIHLAINIINRNLDSSTLSIFKLMHVCNNICLFRIVPVEKSFVKEHMYPHLLKSSELLKKYMNKKGYC